MKKLQFGLILSLLFFSACGDLNDPDDGVICAAVITYAVEVTVKDASGKTVSDATVQFQRNGGAAKDCRGNSTFYECGGGVDGEFKITAMGKDGSTATDTVTAKSGECSVMTEKLELTLAPKI